MSDETKRLMELEDKGIYVMMLWTLLKVEKQIDFSYLKRNNQYCSIEVNKSVYFMGAEGVDKYEAPSMDNFKSNAYRDLTNTAAIDPAIYEEMEISAETLWSGKTIDLKLGVVKFNYYIFLSAVTAQMLTSAVVLQKQMKMVKWRGSRYCL